jgi:hypothetical protein
MIPSHTYVSPYTNRLCRTYNSGIVQSVVRNVDNKLEKQYLWRALSKEFTGEQQYMEPLPEGAPVPYNRMY